MMPKVMIVEDDLMVADMIAETLAFLGYEVCGIARNIGEAVALAKSHRPDLAIIDMRLEDGQLGTDVADQLGALPDIGILFASGNCAQVGKTAIRGHACLTKPYSESDLKRALEIVLDIAATGKATPPLPRGLRVLQSAALSVGTPP